MLPQCLPPSFGSVWLTFWGQMIIEEFLHGGHLGYRNKLILAILNHHVASMPPTNFQLNPTYHSGGDVFEDFQNGHLAAIRMILAILNLYVASMPPIMFRLNPSHGLGDVV